jgi:hypothetical protein
MRLNTKDTTAEKQYGTHSQEGFISEGLFPLTAGSGYHSSRYKGFARPRQSFLSGSIWRKASHIGYPIALKHSG